MPVPLPVQMTFLIWKQSNSSLHILWLPLCRVFYVYLGLFLWRLQFSFLCTWCYRKISCVFYLDIFYFKMRLLLYNIIFQRLEYPLVYLEYKWSIDIKYQIKNQWFKLKVSQFIFAEWVYEKHFTVLSQLIGEMYLKCYVLAT